MVERLDAICAISASSVIDVRDVRPRIGCERARRLRDVGCLCELCDDDLRDRLRLGGVALASFDDVSMSDDRTIFGDGMICCGRSAISRDTVICANSAISAADGAICASGMISADSDRLDLRGYELRLRQRRGRRCEERDDLPVVEIFFRRWPHEV